MCSAQHHGRHGNVVEIASIFIPPFFAFAPSNLGSAGGQATDPVPHRFDRQERRQAVPVAVQSGHRKHLLRGV